MNSSPVSEMSQQILACVAVVGAVTVAGCAQRVEPAPEKSSDSSVRTDEVRGAGVASLQTALSQVCDLDSESYHVLLREAFQLIPPLCIGKPWETVTAEVEKRQPQVVEEWDNGDAMHRYYLLKEDAHVFPNEATLDLYLLLSADNLDGPRTPARPGNVYAADVALVAELNAPYGEIAPERYPVDSLLDVVLKSPSVRADGSRWPILAKVYMNYADIGDWRGQYEQHGFEVAVEFTASLDEEIGAKRSRCTIASGLDPLVFPGGEQRAKDFTPSDTLGGVTDAGGNEWWHGTRDVVEANEAKYLK